ncbi:LysR family transcriptional regulator, partial [Bordetella pertussis]
VRVMPHWQLDSAPVMLLVPGRKGRSARVKALLECFDEQAGHA